MSNAIVSVDEETCPEIRERGPDWSKPLPRGGSFDHFAGLI